MCGRYYMDDETRREIRRLVLKLDPKICSESDQTAAIFPSQKATVITGRGRHLVAEQMLWGFPRFDGRGILINARRRLLWSGTLLERVSCTEDA